MTTAAMMRASTATNAPATDMIGDALLAGEVLVAVVVGGVVLSACDDVMMYVC